MTYISPSSSISACEQNLAVVKCGRHYQYGYFVIFALIYILQNSRLLEEGVITIPEVMFSRYLMEVLVRWAKYWCYIDKLVANLEVLAVIAQKGKIERFLHESLRLTLYKLEGMRWPIITSLLLSCTSTISFWDEYDKLFCSSVQENKAWYQTYYSNKLLIKGFFL